MYIYQHWDQIILSQNLFKKSVNRYNWVAGWLDELNNCTNSHVLVDYTSPIILVEWYEELLYFCCCFHFLKNPQYLRYFFCFSLYMRGVGRKEKEPLYCIHMRFITFSGIAYHLDTFELIFSCQICHTNRYLYLLPWIIIALVKDLLFGHWLKICTQCIYMYMYVHLVGRKNIFVF